MVLHLDTGCVFQEHYAVKQTHLLTINEKKILELQESSTQSTGLVNLPCQEHWQKLNTINRFKGISRNNYTFLLVYKKQNMSGLLSFFVVTAFCFCFSAVLRIEPRTSATVSFLYFSFPPSFEHRNFLKLLSCSDRAQICDLLPQHSRMLA